MSNIHSANKTLVEKLLQGIGEQNWASIADLYDDNVVIRWPFALPESMTICGKKELQATLEKTWKLITFSIENLTIYETNNPDIIIAEYDYDGEVTLTKKKFKGANVLIATIRNQHVVSAKGFHDTVSLMNALGSLEFVTKQISVAKSFRDN